MLQHTHAVAVVAGIWTVLTKDAQQPRGVNQAWPVKCLRSCLYYLQLYHCAIPSPLSPCPAAGIRSVTHIMLPHTLLNREPDIILDGFPP